MLRKFMFALKEARRLQQKNYSKTAYFLGLLVCNHLFTVFLFMTCINLNYMQEVAATGDLPCLLKRLAGNNWMGFNRVRVILFFWLLILGGILFFVNNHYIGYFIRHYKAEIRLIDRLCCSWSYIRWPIFYISFIQNGLALALSFGLGRRLYLLISNFIDKYYHCQLVRFEFFDTSLFIFLMVINSGIVLVADLYLFFKHRIKLF